MMTAPSNPPITQWLKRWSDDPNAREHVVTVLYDELRVLAAREFGRASGQTLQPTALLNEAMIKLLGPAAGSFENRGHFFSAAARAMRQVLVDQARRRHSDKRGSGVRSLPLDCALDVAMPSAEDLLALDAALRDLEKLDPRAARIIELRYFAGLTLEDSAALLDCHPSTVSAEWMHARAWLHARLGA